MILDLSKWEAKLTPPSDDGGRSYTLSFTWPEKEAGEVPWQELDKITSWVNLNSTVRTNVTEILRKAKPILCAYDTKNGWAVYEFWTDDEAAVQDFVNLLSERFNFKA